MCTARTQARTVFPGRGGTERACGVGSAALMRILHTRCCRPAEADSLKMMIPRSLSLSIGLSLSLAHSLALAPSLSASGPPAMSLLASRGAWSVLGARSVLGAWSVLGASLLESRMYQQPAGPGATEKDLPSCTAGPPRYRGARLWGVGSTPTVGPQGCTKPRCTKPRLASLLILLTAPTDSDTAASTGPRDRGAVKGGQ